MTTSKTPRAGTKRTQVAPGISSEDIGPVEGRIVPGAAYVAADTTPPHLTAAHSHLQATPPGFPRLPAEASECGSISLAALDRIAQGGKRGSTAEVTAVDLMHLHPCVARYRAEVLGYLASQG